MFLSENGRFSDVVVFSGLFYAPVFCLFLGEFSWVEVLVLDSRKDGVRMMVVVVGVTLVGRRRSWRRRVLGRCSVLLR